MNIYLWLGNTDSKTPWVKKEGEKIKTR